MTLKTAFVTAIAMAILCLTASPIAGVAAARQESDRVGAYEVITDLKDSGVVKCAEVAVTTLFKTAIEALTDDTGALKDHMDSDLIPNYSFFETARDMGGGLDWESFDVRVVEGSDQVVAGIMYRITIALLDPADCNTCKGGFRVVMYDHFGDISISTWGQEVSCEVLDEMILELDADGGN
uniref:Cystatin domain-containing protein n=1 Tax=Craspedostauros australis TaxID=1486917 RepID=A0A7R9WSG6_9STRA|mmetsp:Transcript_1875/g.5170  ORF Transcript_1875/g.5170 Transcript_1875/m.5170 type:complete len:181 (+) Transcript_1875:175-717(+)